MPGTIHALVAVENL
jgi:hypothetical protein